MTPSDSAAAHVDAKLMRRYRNGLVTGAEREDVESHLLTCDACGRLFDDVSLDPFWESPDKSATARRIVVPCASSEDGSTLPDPLRPKLRGDITPGEASSTVARLKTLRARLLTVYPTSFLVWGAIAFASVVWRHPLVRLETVGFPTQLFTIVNMALFLGGGVLLVARRDLSYRSLVALERAGWLGFVVALASYTFFGLRAGLAEQIAGRDPIGALMSAVALYSGFGWMSAILIFGRAMPNTARDMAALTSLTTAASLLAYAAVVVVEPRQWTALCAPLLLTAETLAVALSFAWFCSFDVLELERELKAVRGLGPYDLKEELGGGGMGKVWVAEHRRLGQRIAVKTIRPEWADEPEILRRFEREARTTARLKHPNTIRVFDFGREADGTFYYVMELLDGFTLNRLVNETGALDPSRALHVWRQVCGALAEAHNAGLTHRDIKPGNIMLCRLGGPCDVAKLLDFGLVRVERRDVGTADPTVDPTRKNLFIGTPRYASPEQTRGEDVDVRSDIYSLGATFYFALTGRPPFDQADEFDLVNAHRRLDPPTFASLGLAIAPELERVVRRCMNKRPDDRYQTIADLELDLLRAARVFPPWTQRDAEAAWARWPT